MSSIYYISTKKTFSPAKFCVHKSNIKVLLAYDSLIYPTTIGVIGAFLRTLGSNLYQEQRTLKSKPSRIICLAPKTFCKHTTHSITHSTGPDHVEVNCR